MNTFNKPIIIIMLHAKLILLSSSVMTHLIDVSYNIIFSTKITHNVKFSALLYNYRYEVG